MRAEDCVREKGWWAVGGGLCKGEGLVGGWLVWNGWSGVVTSYRDWVGGEDMVSGSWVVEEADWGRIFYFLVRVKRTQATKRLQEIKGALRRFDDRGKPPVVLSARGATPPQRMCSRGIAS